MPRLAEDLNDDADRALFDLEVVIDGLPPEEQHRVIRDMMRSVYERVDAAVDTERGEQGTLTNDTKGTIRYLGQVGTWLQSKEMNG